MLVTIAAAIEAVGADLAFGHANGLDKILEFGKLQRGQSQTTGYLLHHLLIFRRVGSGIAFQMLLVVATLEITDDTTGDQFQIALRRGETDKRTTVDQRRTRDTTMHLFGTIVEEGLHIIPQLRTTHDGVVAKDDALVFQQGRVRNQFHLCHE